MNKWITILTFTYPQEAHILQTKLQSENIEVFIKDELTIQTYNFYSNAIGGVKLQVTENDYERAYKILKELGYIKKPEQSNSKSAKIFDIISKKIPIINRLSFEKRLVLFFIIIALFFVYILYVKYN